MTKRELVRSALAHKDCPRVPYAVNFTSEALDLYGERLLADYAPERVRTDYRDGRLSLAEAVSIGIGNHMLSVYAPWWNWHNLPPQYFTDYDAPDGLPETIGTGSYEAFFEKMRYLRETYDIYLLATIWGSHWEKAYFARGIENFLGDLAGSPEWAQSLLDMIIRKNLVMLENFLTTPEIDGVMLGSDWGSQHDLIMSPTCWRTTVKQGEQVEYDLIHRYGKDVFVHSCGNIVRILGDLVDMGLQGLNPVQPECMDIDAIKRDHGHALTFYGGISTQRTLPYGTPEEVTAETLDTIRRMSAMGGYVTGPSQEIQTDVPYENVCALIDAARSMA